jgi:hypothetical protein
MSIALWIVQALLALLSTAAGIRKVRLSQATLALRAPALSALPLPFLDSSAAPSCWPRPA